MPLYRFVQNLYYMLKTILYIGLEALRWHNALSPDTGYTALLHIGISAGHNDCKYYRLFSYRNTLRIIRAKFHKQYRFAIIPYCRRMWWLFTTFSTFVHDNYTLFNDRNIAYMILYSMLSLGLGLLFAHWGHVLIKAE